MSLHFDRNLFFLYFFGVGQLDLQNPVFDLLLPFPSTLCRKLYAAHKDPRVVNRLLVKKRNLYASIDHPPVTSKTKISLRVLP